MLTIEKFDHVGIRISEKAASVAFYQTLGFDLIADAGFEQGHPIIMRNKASGVTINLLGPSTSSTGSTGSNGTNVLMDLAEKHPGYTHIALSVTDLDRSHEALLAEGIDISEGPIDFPGARALFIRDPDGNVIELNQTVPAA